jgi:AraC family transcriptional regulator
MEAVTVKPEILTRPAFTLVGLYYRGKNQHQEIPQLWQKFGPRMDEVQHVIQPNIAYGVMDQYDEATGDFDYLAAYEVSRPADIPAGMTAKEIPTQTYAAFPCTLGTIRQAYAMIYQQWMPKSGYRRAQGPEFELYDETFVPDNPNSKMFLYIPVEPVA